MKLVFFILLLQFSVLSFGDDVFMAFGESIPPFSFPETDTGIEIEVISEALAYQNHKLIPVYYPLARVPIAFKLKQVGAAMTDLGQDMSKIGAYYGDSAVVYDNVFITLKKNDLSLLQPEDLKGLSVISFQGAIKRYPLWLDSVNQAGKYHEQNNQLLQVLTLDNQHYDVVLSDISIYKYYALQAEQKSGKKLNEVQFHRFVDLNPADYRPIFWSERIRNDFNQGLLYLKETGRYQGIYDKYLKAKPSELASVFCP